MCQTIVITTTEQANSMLEALDAASKHADKDNYAAERAKPIKWMSCTCCGESYRGRQWWNQDCGYGLGDCCVDTCGASRTPNTKSQCYGVAGIHFLIADDNGSNHIDENVGVCLHGVDERFRIDCTGYVYWRGVHIDHWSGSLLEKNEESIAEIREMVRRCELLESQGKPVDASAVVWNWTE